MYGDGFLLCRPHVQDPARDPLEELGMPPVPDDRGQLDRVPAMGGLRSGHRGQVYSGAQLPGLHPSEHSVVAVLLLPESKYGGSSVSATDTGRVNCEESNEFILILLFANDHGPIYVIPTHDTTYYD